MPLVPPSNPPEADRVMTPRPLAKQIIDHFPLSGSVLDPCRGDGAFYDQLPAASVEKDWCEIEEGRDFLTTTRHYDWIITNPPWSKHRKFAQHAYAIADNVVFLITVNHEIGLKARLRDMKEAGFGIVEVLFIDTPEKPWPQSGFQLGVVWKQRGYRGATTFTFM